MREIIDSVYVYCTDFTIFLANMFGITYEDSNALIFCIVWPVFTILLIVFFFMQLALNRRVLKK
jgi:hypothetical protein